jgi:uncharacterized protein (DUF1800 family)
LNSLNRRTVLGFVGGLSAAGVWGVWQNNRRSSEVKPTAVSSPSGSEFQFAAATTKPPLAPLEVIALNRLAFGPRPGDYAKFKARAGGSAQAKLESYLEEQLHPESIPDLECDARLAQFSTLNKSYDQLWKDHWVEAQKLPDADGVKWQRIYQPTDEARKATLLRAVYSERQLLEVLVDFWHNHFNSNPDKDGMIAATWVDYDNLMRQYAFGNFRELLTAVAQHPAMLLYLDTASNTRSGPNENYVRELFELHTLGAENYLGVGRQKPVKTTLEGQPVGYVDDDVYEASRAFTGWMLHNNLEYPKNDPDINASGRFLVRSMAHDRFQKNVLGRFLPPDQAAAKDGLDVLETLAYHPGTARHIARKLCRRLISDNPPETVVQAAAQVFLEQKNAPDQLRQVVRAIVRSSEFLQTWGEKIKRPLEAGAAMLRAVNADIQKTDGAVWVTANMQGQPLFGRIPPDGYPDTRAHWSGTSSLLMRWKMAQALCWGGIEETHSNLLAQTPDHIKSCLDMAQFWLARVLGTSQGTGSSPSSKAQIVAEFVSWGLDIRAEIPADQRNDRVNALVSLVLMVPELQYR